jgi:outer membrane lipoprotein-sorting protein
MNVVLGMLWVLFAQAEPQAEAEEFLERFRGERVGIESFVADFTQRTITPDEVLDQTGRIVYLRPQRIRFTYDDGTIDFMLDGLRIYEYDSEFEQLQMYDLEDRPETEALFLGFESEPGRLQEAYDVAVRPRPGGEPGIELELTPKPVEDEEPLFLGVTLQLRPEDFLPVAIAIRNDEESSVLYALSGHRVNSELTEDDITIHAPANTVIVQNDQYVETVGPEGKRFPEPVPPPSEENAAPLVDSEDLP